MEEITDIKEKHEMLIQAYTDHSFQEKLDKKRMDIKKIIEEHAKGLKRECSRIDNVFSIESRVKDISSFEEKLYRKNYITKWTVYDDIASNQSVIQKELTDIIGIRINCYFAQYEEIIYSSFQKAEDEFKGKGFSLDFGENTIQKNGHKIYKFSGKYDNTHFEVQIKSVIHNVWGETEHKTVYKNLSYDGYIEEKKVVTNTLFDILRASETQLYSLFSMEEKESQLIRSLFFCYTKDDVAKVCNTKILAFHYINYFKAFQNLDIIKEYVITRLQGEQFRPKGVSVSGFRDKLKDIVKDKFPFFYLDCLYKIDSNIHEHESIDTFLSYFLETVLPDESGEEFDEMFDETFGESSENCGDEEEDMIQKINDILGNSIIV